jgi:kynureninase
MRFPAAPSSMPLQRPELNARALAEARRRDAADALGAFRNRFALPRNAQGELLVYLCGQSLGLEPLAARERVLEELDDWARLGALGHESGRRPWIPYHENLTAGLAYLAGARPSEVIAMNSLTINLHLMLASFYRPSGTRTRILIEAGAFPSDHQAVASQIEWHGLDPATELIALAPPAGQDLISTESIETLLDVRGEDIAVVLWPGVQYRTGQAFDLARIARAARRRGCIVGFDLAHSIGNLPLALHDSDADFAVWCSYKYLNAGPGAVGGAYVHERHLQRKDLPRLTGWWGHRPQTRFQMPPGFEPAAGASAWAISNPPIFSTAPLRASLPLFIKATMDALRAKSIALTASFEATVTELAGNHLDVVTSADSQQRGCQLSLRLKRGAGGGRQVFQALSARGIVTDWREPDIIRLAPVPLYNSFEDVLRGAWQLAEILSAHH